MADEARNPVGVAAETAAVIAVDVGNSKTDVALVAASGAVLATRRGPTCSHQQVGAVAGFARLVGLADEAAARAGLEPGARPMARMVAYGAAGADLPSDMRLLVRHLRGTGLAPVELVVNDCYLGLRAGATRPWGICVICGSGINCLAVAPSGRVARFDALGDISGDWGGGGGLGMEALAAAVRAQDGRGPLTSLARLVPAHFGLKRPRALTAALYRGTIAQERLLELAPLVFEAAVAGDGAARAIVDRLADEVVSWATAAIRRLQLQRRDPEVVLAGSIFRAVDPRFHDRIAAGIAAVAPAAQVRRLFAPPVVGAALLGLDRLAGTPTAGEVERRLRAELTEERLAGG